MTTTLGLAETWATSNSLEHLNALKLAALLAERWKSQAAPLSGGSAEGVLIAEQVRAQ